MANLDDSKASADPLRGTLNGEANVAVIGGGWAGLAAAVSLAESGARVTLFEAAQRLGGRARSLPWPGPAAQGSALSPTESWPEIDNGQHVLIGACRATLTLLEHLGASLEHCFRRTPFALESDRGLRVRAANLPAPWHLLHGLLTARGLSWAQRWQMTRFIRQLEKDDWTVNGQLTVRALLGTARQSNEVQKRFWDPLCVAALNTDPTEACALTFTRVLRHSLGSDAGAADLLVPQVPLGALLPSLARRFLSKRQGRLVVGHRVREIGWQDGRLQIDQQGWDGAVLAVPSANARSLVGPSIPELATESILTVWILCKPGALADGLQLLLEDGPGEWLFTRTLNDQRILASVVISATRKRSFDRTRVAQHCVAQIDRWLRQNGSRRGLSAEDILRTTRIEEKSATFACYPGLERPAVDAVCDRFPTLMLAGDWTASEHPSTLEAAVRSGQSAAHSLTRTLTRSGVLQTSQDPA